MKRMAAVVAVVLLCFASAAYADSFSIHITVDENGNGTFTNTTGFYDTLTGYMAADPGPGGASSALTYSLLNPPGLISGDLLIYNGSVFSDVVRFNSSNGTLVFYSNPADGYDSLADIASPPGSYYSNTLTLFEIDGVVNFTPTAGQPGFVTGAAGPITYTLLSDPAPVPEPSSLLLIGTGVLGAVGALRRRFNA
ncbi:PEP-CTERM sorting domain-containing protein [Edaphobacter albus]|uniref:PEP-CTERM sorting domain-containing protein n=1 Tax=Edaphobacter sp. 4G125 TaxID=2763071 RepID=UPI0016472256|nr:PEP-CTERM sorting domain-containing protein [Edaphobacter sp. 4G125]QNI36493.1 PEP-CTERM sorting domain-containing protein [Edaphobacter sp. 4G125]